VQAWAEDHVSHERTYHALLAVANFRDDHTIPSSFKPWHKPAFPDDALSNGALHADSDIGTSTLFWIERVATANPAGESNDGVLRLDFDRRLTVQFCG
jgi:hypothetical protein